MQLLAIYNIFPQVRWLGLIWQNWVTLRPQVKVGKHKCKYSGPAVNPPLLVRALVLENCK